VVGQRTWADVASMVGPRLPYHCALVLVFTTPLLAALACIAPLYMYIFRSISTGWQVANEIANPQVSINSSIDCSLHCIKLQPEMEICNLK